MNVFNCEQTSKAMVPIDSQERRIKQFTSLAQIMLSLSPPIKTAKNDANVDGSLPLLTPSLLQLWNEGRLEHQHHQTQPSKVQSPKAGGTAKYQRRTMLSAKRSKTPATRHRRRQLMIETCPLPFLEADRPSATMMPRLLPMNEHNSGGMLGGQMRSLLRSKDQDICVDTGFRERVHVSPVSVNTTGFLPRSPRSPPSTRLGMGLIPSINNPTSFR